MVKMAFMTVVSLLIMGVIQRVPSMLQSALIMTDDHGSVL